MSESEAEVSTDGPVLPFPIIGIGASAGGLEALQDIFSNLKDGTNVAFFVVQHLSPDFKSMMVDILRRHTNLDVQHAEDGLPITQGHVYLLPPQKDVQIRGRWIHLEDRPSGGKLHMPIDLFLESLARSQRELAVAVILSGTGTDGTRGVLEIRRHGGVVMVQDPNTAKFDGMPRSAIASGTADYVLSPCALAEQLKVLPSLPPSPSAIDTETEPLKAIFDLVGREARVDLAYYKEGTLLRRIHRRMQIRDQATLSAYASVLAEDETELQNLCVDLLIGVTQFFRDPPAWQWLEDNVLTNMVEAGLPVRMWVAGCSTGQEAYSLAMAVYEMISATGKQKFEFRVFATDANPRAIRDAMAGEYTTTDIESVPEALRRKYFEPVDDKWRVRRFLRDTITFAVHNLMTDPPFTRLDLVLCRNLLIYLRAEAQRPVLARIHFGLKEGGVLFLGPSETVGDQKPLFQPIDLKWKLFRAIGGSGELTQMFGVGSPSAFGRPPSRRRNVPEVQFKAVLEHYVPPGVVLDSTFDVIHIFGNITPYIQLSEGRASLNLMNMLPPAVAVFLSSTARRVRASGESTTIPGVELNGAVVDLRIMLPTPGPLGEDQGLLVFFEQPTSEAREGGPAFELSHETAVRIQELRDELLMTRENLRTAVEDLEATNEELQATNEELIASNEELQSTNEELQSVNEELFTVNTEYQEKIEELEALTGDLENLLRSVDVGILFLDAELRVRRYNQTVLRLVPLQIQDLGRKLTDLTIHADYPGFHEQVQEVLDSRSSKLAGFQGEDGTSWTVQIRPFDEGHRHAGGVIVLFHNRTAWQKQNARIGELTANAMAAGLAGVGMVLVDPRTRTTRPSDLARRLLGVGPDEEVSYELLQELLAGNPAEGDRGKNNLPTDSLRQHHRPDGTQIILRVFAQRLIHQGPNTEQVVVALQQVSL